MIVHFLASVLDAIGYPLVGVVVMLESAGIPLPGETILLVAAAYSATGRLNLEGVIAAGAAGAIVGDTLGYWIGRTRGLAFLERHGRLFRVNSRRLERARRFFARHGAKTVFFGRFVAFLRIFAAFLAGVARMRYGTFLAYNALGGVTWATTMGLLGNEFARRLPLVERWVNWIGVGGAALVIAVAAALWLRRRRSYARSKATPASEARARNSS